MKHLKADLGSSINRTESLATPASPNPLEISEAIHAAAAAIYFNDSSDYERALWTVLRKLAPGIAEVMEADPGAAYMRTKDGVPVAVCAKTDLPMCDNCKQLGRCVLAPLYSSGVALPDGGQR